MQSHHRKPSNMADYPDAAPMVVGRADPRTQMRMPSEFEITLGGRTYTMYAQQCQGTGNGSQSLNWNPTIPSPNVILCRTIYTVIQYDITVTGNGDKGRPLFDIGTNDGPRFLPTCNAINNQTMTINGVPFSLAADPIPTLARYWINPSDSSDMLSMSTSQMDQYSDIAKWQWYGQTRNSLCSWGESNKPGDSRGGSVSYCVCRNSNTNALISLVAVEPLFLSPLTQKIDAPGFSQIKNFTLQLTMQPSYQRIWQRAPPSTDGGSVPNPFPAAAGTSGNSVAYGVGLQGSVVLDAAPAVAINNGALQPLLVFMTITPQEGKSLPRTLTYDYSQWIQYTNDIATFVAPTINDTGFLNGAAAAQTPFTSASYQLNTIPDELYIYVGDSINDKYLPGNTNSTGFVQGVTPATTALSPIYQTDNYWRICRIQITFNNEVSLLVSQFAASGNLTSLDYYLMCLRNGYQGSFQDWAGHSGGVTCIRPGIDFGLPPGLVPGMTGVWNLQVTVYAQNISDIWRRGSLYVVPRTFGIMKIEAGQITQNIGVVTQGMLSQAWSNIKGSWMSPFAAGKVGFGGDFFDSIKKFGIKHVVPHLTWENANRAYNFAAPRIQAYLGRKMTGRGLPAPEGFQASDMEVGDDEDKDFRHQEGQIDDDHPAAALPAETGYERAQAFKRRREDRDRDPGFAPAKPRAESGIRFS